MNYLKEAEDIIKNCGKLQDSLQNLKNRKTHLLLKTQPKEASGIDYSKPNIQKQSYSNDTLSQLCEIAQVNEQIKETEAEIKIVKDILKQIKKENETLEKFLRIRYIENPKDNLKLISRKLGYSEDSNHTIYDIKNNALREFAIRYFGVRAIKNT